MAIRYNGENGEPNLSIKDDINTIDLCDDVTHTGYIGKLSTLLEWHTSDPVDDFERSRNNVIHTYQHNRNPFIDCPLYASEIWQNNTPILNDQISDLHLSISSLDNGFRLVVNNKELVSVKIFDSFGILISNKSHYLSFEYTDLSNGFYIIYLHQNNISVCRKLVVL